MRRREPLIRELPAGADVSARMLHLHDRHPDRYPAFLDSAATGGSLGRYSILVAAPGEQLILGRNGQLSGPGAGTRFCERLNAWWREEQGPAPPPPWPFAGGWFLYLGYELAGEVEPTLTLPLSALDVVACAWRMRAALVHDHRTGQTIVAAEPGAEAAAGQLAADFTSARARAGACRCACSRLHRRRRPCYLSRGLSARARAHRCRGRVPGQSRASLVCAHA